MFFSAATKQFISSAPRGNALKSSRPHRLKRLMAHGAVGAALLATWFAVPAQALTWNWSDTGNTTSGQGTFTTAGTTAQAGITEAITAITGTYTRSGTGGVDGTFQITGLSNLNNADNLFSWDGTNSSAIYADAGIAFSTDYLKSVLIDYDDSGFGPVSITTSSFLGNDGVIISSSLSPVLATAPGPVPLFGAAAAFGCSRQLRRRIKTPA